MNIFSRAGGSKEARREIAHKHKKEAQEHKQEFQEQKERRKEIERLKNKTELYQARTKFKRAKFASKHPFGVKNHHKTTRKIRRRSGSLRIF
jgi:hypothetical protein